MSESEDYTPVNVHDIGIDRSRINRYHQVELPQRNEVIIPPQGQDEHAEPERKRDKIKKALHLKKHNTHDPQDLPQNNYESALFANTENEPPKGGLKATVGKVAKHLDKETIGDFVKDPYDTIKNKAKGQGGHEAAANIAASEIPYEHEKELLRAHDAVKNAQSETEKKFAFEKLESLLRERHTSYVRWTLDRHITKVRVLPRNLMTREPISKFQHKSTRGQVITDWNGYMHHLFMYYVHQYGGQYIGAGTGVPEPSKQNLIPNIERLLVASAPFQQIAMTIRRVYKWQNPSETAKYLVIYIILWWFDLILCGILSAIVYFVVERYVQGFTLEDLRKDIKRTEDAQETALSITDFIEKRGDERWADDVVQAVGPWLMMQIADMSNAFEALRNFYEWRVPHRTMIALSFMIVSIITLVLTPQWLLAKGIGLGFGFTSFCLWPISTRHPEYRLLTSVPKRVFWNIPTNAEWAIKYIQAESSRQLAKLDECRPNDSEDETVKSTIFGTYNAQYNSTGGRLTVSASTVCFRLAHDDSLHVFNLSYDQVVNVEKKNRPISQLKSESGKDLKLVNRAGQEWLLENVDKRDMAFSQIIGLSNQTWQVIW